MGYSDSSKSRGLVGFAGLDNTVSLPTHNDHNSSEGVVPPIGRGLQDRLGVDSRTDCITQQGGAALLAAWKKTRGTPSPKRVAGRTDSRPYDPSKGGESDRGDNASLTLWAVQETIRELALEHDYRALKKYAADAISVHPEWGVALTACVEHWTRGGRTPQTSESES